MADGTKKMISVDVGEFVRTRDALNTSFMHLSGAIDQAVKAYIDHTNTVIHSGGTWDVGKLLQPFQTLGGQAALLQQQALAGMAAAFGENGKRKRAKRPYKPRDPNAPKRPLTAYFRFLAEQRKAIAEELGKGGKPGDITKKATDKWNALSHAQKEPYKQAYQREAVGYDDETAKYKANGGKIKEDEENVGDGESVPEADSDAEDAEADDDDSSDEDADEESEVDEPIPPPKAPEPSRESVKTPKSAMKKGGKHSFSSINLPASATAAPITEPAKSSSPELKRKASSDEANGEGGKKRKRKSKGIEEAAVEQPTPIAEPVVAEVEKKVKKSRKRKSDA